MITIDGSIGEGGGQVLRSSLALSLLTRQKVHLIKIRAGRKKPGLQPQHLAAVRAAADVSRAQVEGAQIGSQEIVFQPEGIVPGKYRWDIGTAGATTLVLQTVCLPLARAETSSTLTITGGTHVPRSPSFHFIDLAWKPVLRKIGISMDFVLEQAGFYPQGRGVLRANIQPMGKIQPLETRTRGALQKIRGISAVANLDRKIAERQRSQVLRRIGARYKVDDLRIVDLPSRVKGTMLLLLAEFENSQSCYCALGALGKPAEAVADEAVDSLLSYLDTDGAFDQYMADQLLLPLSLASGSSRFSTSQITSHLLTNAVVIQAFLPVKIAFSGEPGHPGTVLVEPA